MLLIEAIVRPEKADAICEELLSAGFPGVSKMDVYGRGKQRGIIAGGIQYDDLPKTMLMFFVNDEDKDDFVRIILKTARTGEKGAYGDGRVFVTPVAESYTVSSGSKDALTTAVAS